MAETRYDTAVTPSKLRISGETQLDCATVGEGYLEIDIDESHTVTLWLTSAQMRSLGLALIAKSEKMKTSAD